MDTYYLYEYFYIYKTWIHRIIRVFIPMYTYNYMSIYTFIEIM